MKVHLSVVIGCFRFSENSKNGFFESPILSISTCKKQSIEILTLKSCRPHRRSRIGHAAIHWKLHIADGRRTPPRGQEGNVSIESACREIPSIPFDICERAILDPGKAYSLIADVRRRSHQGDSRCSAPRRVSRDTVVCDRRQFPSEQRRDSSGFRPLRRHPSVI